MSKKEYYTEWLEMECEELELSISIEKKETLIESLLTSIECYGMYSGDDIASNNLYETKRKEDEEKEQSIKKAFNMLSEVLREAGFNEKLSYQNHILSVGNSSFDMRKLRY